MPQLKRTFWPLAAIFIVLALTLVLVLHFGIRTSTAIEGYLAGNGQWMSAQKKTIMELVRYGKFEDERYYRNHRQALQIIEGYQQFRVSLSKEEPAFEEAQQGIRRGNISPDFADPMEWFFLNTRNMDRMARLIDIWAEADRHMEQVRDQGLEIRRKIQNNEMSTTEWSRHVEQLYELEDTLNVLGNEFAQGVAATGNQVSRLLFWATFLLISTLILCAALITVHSLRRLTHLNSRLAEAEHRFRTVLENSRDEIYQIDVNQQRYEYISPSARELHGYSEEEMMKLGPRFFMQCIHPDDREYVRKEAESFLQGLHDLQSDKQTLEFRMKTKSGDWIWVNTTRKLLRDEQGAIIGLVGNARDVTQQKNQLEQIQDELQEKQTLLSEVHHRVKNNLAVIIGMLYMQGEQENDTRLQKRLQESMNRIQTMATIHDQLYQNESFSHIDFRQNLCHIVSHVTRIHQDGERIEAEYDCDPVSLNVNQAIPCSLIVNEVISNCLQHAFGPGEKGAIRVSLKQQGDQVKLDISDNGCGLPDKLPGAKQSLGMSLIEALTQQLKGDFDYRSSGKGTCFSLRFYKLEVKGTGNYSL